MAYDLQPPDKTIERIYKMQHDYSLLTQGIFATIFGLFALVGPVIGVSFSDSFGVRALIAEKKNVIIAGSDTDFTNHEKFFCSDWAGNCVEKRLMHQVNKLIN